MKTRYTVVLSMVAGAALGGAAVQAVNAQLAAKKAYTVTELETLNPQAAADLASASRLRKPMQEVAISALAAERLSAWRGHRRPRAWRSRNGRALRRQRPSSIERIDRPRSGPR